MEGWAPLLYHPLQSSLLLLWAFKVAGLPEKCIPVAQWASLGTCSVSLTFIHSEDIYRVFNDVLGIVFEDSCSCGIHRQVHRQYSLTGSRMGENMGYYGSKQEVAKVK